MGILWCVDTVLGTAKSVGCIQVSKHIYLQYTHRPKQTNMSPSKYNTWESFQKWEIRHTLLLNGNVPLPALQFQHFSWLRRLSERISRKPWSAQKCFIYEILGESEGPLPTSFPDVNNFTFLLDIKLQLLSFFSYHCIPSALYLYKCSYFYWNCLENPPKTHIVP